MVWFGPTSSIFDVTTFLIMFFFVAPQLAGGSYHALGAEQQELFISISNLVGLLSHYGHKPLSCMH